MIDYNIFNDIEYYDSGEYFEEDFELFETDNDDISFYFKDLDEYYRFNGEIYE